MRKWFSVIAGALRIFFASRSLDMAAAISFYFLFSLIPILLLVTAALAYMLGARPDLMDKVAVMAREMLPYLTTRMVEDFKRLSGAWKALGWVSFLVLLYGADMVLNALSKALVEIFGVTQRYGYLRRKVANFAVITLAVIVALVSVLSSAAMKVISSIDMSLMGMDLGYYFVKGALSFLVLELLPFVFLVASVALVYRMLSGKNLSFRYAFFGSFAFGVMWEAGKSFFVLYIKYFPVQERFFSSIGTAMMLLVWIFFSSVIFLFSAALARSAFDVFAAGRKGAEKPARKGRLRA